MIIIRDTNGITVKRNETSVDYVRIGVTMVYIGDTDGRRRYLHDAYKPHNDYTVGELVKLCEQHTRQQ